MNTRHRPDQDTDNNERLALNHWRLDFIDKKAESEYLDATLLRSLGYIRFYMCTGALCFMLFGILDALVLPLSTLYYVWIIRFGIVTPILFGILAHTYHKNFKQQAQFSLALAMLASGLGVVAMTAVLPSPFAGMYYAGIILVVAYCGSLIRMKFVYTVGAAMLLFTSYQFVALLVNPVPHEVYFTNTFFLAMATGIGIFTGYLHELYLRRAYIADMTIRRQSESSRLLLIETQAANKAKSEFLATMSHELRTPLNAICGFSEIIEGEMFGPVGCAKYADYAKDIRASGNHLLSIINDILDIAKAEAGKLVLNEEAFDLAEVLESTVRMVTGTAEQKGLQILTGGVDSAVMVCADQRLLSQAILNLLSNAIKFTEERGRVKVSLVSHDTGDVSIEIVDTGVGIAPADMDRIMRPFEQVEGAMSRQNGGTGLGLPYSQKISEIHGGRLTLESALGLGTRCRIVLPEWRHLDSMQALKLRKAS